MCRHPGPALRLGRRYKLSAADAEINWIAPMPDVRRARLRQTLRYLEAHWPVSRPTKLLVRRIGARLHAQAICDHTSSGFVIRIDSRACYYFADALLQHEYAHAVAWDVDPTDHGAAWGGVYLDITRAFEDGDAIKESLSW